MAGCPQIPQIQHQQPQAMNLCSQRSRSVRITPPHPSPGRGSFITAPCNKKARKSSLHQKKKWQKRKSCPRFFLPCFRVCQPSETTKRVQLALRISTSKKSKTSAAELGSKSKSLKIFPKIRFFLLQKIKIFNLNLSGIPISAQGSPRPSLPPACPQRAVDRRRLVAAAPARHLGISSEHPTNKKTLCHTNPIGY